MPNISEKLAKIYLGGSGKSSLSGSIRSRIQLSKNKLKKDRPVGNIFIVGLKVRRCNMFRNCSKGRFGYRNSRFR